MANFFPLNANTTLKVDNKTSKELLRPLANFSPCKWGDRFLSFSLDKVELEAYAKASEEPKEELRRLLIDPTIDSNAKLSLIYSMYRLGLTYLFMEEIDGLLDKLFNEHNLQDYDEVDLYTISIHFHVFRIHGYKLSCDVFNKFMDNSLGTFKEYIISDVRGMLSFYESAHLGIKGESILDEALQFTEAQLKSVVNTLEGNLASQVKQALRGPFHRGLPIVEARLYFSNYEEDFSTNDSLLKLAKSHFNYLQLQQKEELRIISKWCRDMEFNVITPYIRDRVPELYLWILTFFFEPHYSQARIITSKIVQLVLVLDDTMDAYATIDEMRLLIDSINRWETSAMEQLPGYMKPFYKIILNEYAELEKQLAKEGREDRVKPSKEAFQELARAYLKEAEWRHSGEVPSFKEYMKNGLTTSAYDLMCKSALLGMKENIANEKIWAWFETHPKILKASEFISRFHNDVMTFEFERERTQSATGVDAYVKTYGVPENVAIVEIKKMVENAWKDINEGCLKPREIPMDILVPIVNLARVIDVVYKYGDEFTFPKKSFKEYITLLFIDSVTK